MIVRPQHIKSLEALIRIDTYSKSNTYKSKLPFFKLDYVPMAGRKNDILPEWLSFHI